jgi:hypothetical protein
MSSGIFSLNFLFIPLTIPRPTSSSRILEFATEMDNSFAITNRVRFTPHCASALRASHSKTPSERTHHPIGRSVQAEFFIGLTTGQKLGAMLVALFSGRIFFIFQVTPDFARATNRISILKLIAAFAFSLLIGWQSNGQITTSRSFA